MPLRRIRRYHAKLGKRRRLRRSLGSDGLTAKTREELDYWQRKQAEEGGLRNDWYRRFFVDHSGLGDDSFSGKRILDIGCGPRGSLEWADTCAMRIGVDPLAHRYRELGTDAHRMSYIAAGAERLPLRDSSFDIVSSFNSLDHTDDVDASVREIERVLARDGIFLLLVDVNHPPTDSEPQMLDWDVVDRFAALEPVEARHYEHAGGVYQSILEGRPFDHGRSDVRRGVLSALFRKPG